MNGNAFEVVKPKRQIAHIDSVNQAPGQGYINWIIVTREKLLERETGLLSIRMDLVKRVLYRSIEEFNNNSLNIKYGINISIQHINNMFEIINNNLINVSIEYLKKILSHWNGVDLTRSTKQFTTFRKYFMVSKNWFDHRKKSVLTEHFWLKILHAIQQFSRNVATDYFYKDNEAYLNKYLLFHLLYVIFASKTQFSSTKPQPLIPGGTIKDTTSIKQFLENLDQSLKTKGKNTNNNDMSAKQTLNIILNQLSILTVQYKNIFHNNLCMNNLCMNNNNSLNTNSNFKIEHNVDFSNFYHDKNQNNLIPNDFSSNDFSPNDSPLMLTPIFPTTNNNLNITNNSIQSKTRISNPFLPNINNVNNQNNNNNNNFSYAPVHSSNIYVSSENRHNPLNYYQCNEINNSCTCNCNNCNIITY